MSGGRIEVRHVPIAEMHISHGNYGGRSGLMRFACGHEEWNNTSRIEAPG